MKHTLLSALCAATLTCAAPTGTAQAFIPTRARVLQFKLIPVGASMAITSAAMPAAIVSGSFLVPGIGPVIAGVGIALTGISTYNLGKTSISHDAITEMALRSILFEFYDIHKDTPEITAARSDIVSANIHVDDDQKSPWKHFDNESFSEGQTWITAQKQTAVQLARQRRFADARWHLGQALHAIQDFYSHSNWIELGNRVIHEHLGQDDYLFQNPAPDRQACVKGNVLITDTLTSGYYSDSAADIPAHKCLHGEVRQGNGIAKDSGLYTFGRLKDGHKIAAALAITASRKYLWELRSALKEEALVNGILGVSAEIHFTPR